MPDVSVAEMFAEFEEAARDTFRPPGVAEAQRRVRARRRQRRSVLAAVTALLLAGSAGGLAVAHRRARPEPRPAPVVTPTPDGRITVRKVSLPGVPGDLVDLRFVDSRTGWAFFDTCDPRDSGASGCRRTVARSTDGGATWRRASLPAAPTGSAHLIPVDGTTLVVEAGGRYLVTTDGGATFSDHPLDAPPDAIQRMTATPSGLIIGCPSPYSATDAHTACELTQVMRVGVGALPHQPPVALRRNVENSLFEGGDGRLWLTALADGRLSVVTSADSGASWRRLPAVDGARALTVSPDGREVWLVRTDRPNGVWRLVGDRWQQQPGLPDDTDQVAAMGAGLLAVASAYGGLGFWQDGRYVDVPELREPLRSNPDSQPGVVALRDGTLLVTYGRTLFLGTGRGTDRTWTWIS
ncbi:WD40/YVTN/BNR-like repeat-containing protein [Micromonospora chersina]|uniref:WD40/YVTN/BNR-like repeat-containing protein n=1 Tax=Micromonospora chersina TaxID=47854 RepID=UPI0033E68838